jgi:oligopeptide transport system substrate-binding protein
MLILLGGAMLWSQRTAPGRADFTFVNRGDNKTLDLNSMSWMQDIRLAYALWEGLYTLDPQTLQPIPGCAYPIDLDDSRTVYTFHIRPEARWTNGDPVTSGDFLFAWRRMLEQPGDYTYLLYKIKGAKEYADSFAEWANAVRQRTAKLEPDFGIVGVNALDGKTLRVTLQQPVPYFPAVCAFPPLFPQHEPSMRKFGNVDEKLGRIMSYRQDFTRPPNLVTNGPYEMTEWTFKRRVRMTASKYYWDRAHVKSQTIDQVNIEDGLGAFRAYESGTVDWLAEVDSDLAPELKAQGRSDLHVFPAFGTYFYSINCKPALPDGRPNPFHDVRVRQAFTMAIDKRPIVENVTRMHEPIATTYVPPGVFPDYPSPKGLGYDVAGARRLLAEAGYPNGQGFPRITILFNNEFEHGKIAQVVRRQWLTNLNVETDLEGVEIKIFGARLHDKEYAVARASWYGDYQDPTTFTDKYLSYSDNNDAGWVNQKYDDLCDLAAKEPDPKARMRLLAEAEGILCQEAPIIPMYYYLSRYMLRSNVHGVPLDPRNMVMMQAVEVTR